MQSPSNQFLRTRECYLSIQGEGGHTGLSCYFIRTAGCDLRCAWCDSPSALSAKSGDWVSKESLLTEIPAWVSTIQITGGEPLLQKEAVIQLCEALHQKHTAKILIETGGHIDLVGIPNYCHIVMDIKLGSSGEVQHDFARNLKYLKPSDEIKFAIANRADYEEALDWLKTEKLETRFKVLFSIVWDSLTPEKLTGWILEDHLNVRFQLQLHKIIWGNKESI